MHPGPLLHDVISNCRQVFFLAHLLVACWAVDVVTVDGFRGIPLCLDFRVEAFSVKYVLAAELHTCSVAQSLGVAECTEVVECHSECIRLVFL